MILIADGGSTKVDWIALDNNKKELFRITSSGLNPAVLLKDELITRLAKISEFNEINTQVKEIHFYGAGCGSSRPTQILKDTLQSIFCNAKVNVSEDLLAAVYATAAKKPSIVCILGTGSNSCYYDGQKITKIAPSLGYTIMDEASGNYFGKKLLKDFFYNKMPKKIADSFYEQYNLDINTVKENLYTKPNPNMYLASFSKFMFLHKEEAYIIKLIEKGFCKFFKYHILPYNKDTKTPIYFIGSIAYYFRDTLKKIALQNNLVITNIIQKPIDDLVKFHQQNTI